VHQILERLDVPLTEAERKSIEYVPTDSIPAFEHYSLSLDHFDTGDWHRALLECRLAVRADADFLKAKARLADLYCDLGEPDHALIEYRKLIEADQENLLPESVYYKMGRLLEDSFGDDAGAAAVYEKIVARHPEYERTVRAVAKQGEVSEGPHSKPDRSRIWSLVATHETSLRTLERRALISERKDEGRQAAEYYSRIVAFLMLTDILDGTSISYGELRARIFSKYEPMYWRLVLENRDAGLTLPASHISATRGRVYRIPPEGGGFSEEDLGDVRDDPDYSRRVLCVAPPEREIAELLVQVNCTPPKPPVHHPWVGCGWHEPIMMSGQGGSGMGNRTDYRFGGNFWVVMNSDGTNPAPLVRCPTGAAPGTFPGELVP